MPRRGRSGRFEKGGGRSRRRASRRSYGGRRRSKPVHSLTDIGGAAATVYGAFLAPYDNGDGPIAQLKAGNYSTAFSEASPTNWALKNSPGAGVSSGKKNLVYGGIVLLAGGRVAGWLMPSLKRPIKLGRMKFRLVG